MEKDFLVFQMLCVTITFRLASSQDLQVAVANKSLHREPGFAYAYFIRHTNSKLDVENPRQYHAPTYKPCAVACTNNMSCLSFNFGRKPIFFQKGHPQFLCELLATDKYNSTLKYQGQNPDFDHYSIRSNCSKSPCLHNFTCIANYTEDTYECSCPRPAFVGKHCKVSSNCSELLSAGYTQDGVYQIDPDGQGSFPVYCDMTTDGGGWIVIQRNRDNSPVSFNRGWQGYKTGFGNLSGEFWLGLEKIHRLTKRQKTSLRVDLEDLNENTRYAVYSSFSIADESDFYRLHVSGYSGTAGDSLTTNSNPFWVTNNMRFSTPDKDNDLRGDGGCAVGRKAGWWYNWCSISDLNGDRTWWSFSETLKNTQMELK